MMVGVMLWNSVTWRDNRSIGARRPDTSVPLAERRGIRLGSRSRGGARVVMANMRQGHSLLRLEGRELPATSWARTGVRAGNGAVGTRCLGFCAEVQGDVTGESPPRGKRAKPIFAC